MKTDVEIQSRNNLTAVLDSLNMIKPESLIRADVLGTQLSFASGVDDFRRALNLFQDLHGLDLERLPIEVINNLYSYANQLKEILDRAKAFTPTDNNPSATRDSIIQECRNAYHSWFNVVSPLVAYATNYGTDLDVLHAQALDLMTQIKSIKDESSSESQKLLTEVSSTLEKVRQAAADVGVAQHATHFKEEATEYEKIAQHWFYGVVVLGIATAIWGYYGFTFSIPAEKQNDNIHLIQAVVARFSVFMTLLIMLFWSSKNYTAARHNYVVNKHRQNALSTFETFVKASGDDVQTKNAVLLQATQSIFSAQNTGFSGKDAESESSGKIIEIFKDVSKLTGK